MELARAINGSGLAGSGPGGFGGANDGGDFTVEQLFTEELASGGFGGGPGGGDIGIASV